MKLLYLANIRLPTEKAHGVQIMKMCEAFSQKGVEVRLVVPNRRNSLKEEPFFYYGIKHRFSIDQLSVWDTVSWGKIGFWVESIQFAFQAALYARKHKEAILYSRDELPLLFASIATKCSAIWETHTGSWNFFAKKIARRVTRIVSISEGLKKFYIEKGVLPDKIIVAHDAVDQESFAHPEASDVARRRLGIPLGKKVVLYVGRLDGWKGAETFCEASSFLPEGILPVIIGGEAQQVGIFKEKYPHVLFLGYRPYRELADNQSAADVLVLPNSGKDHISIKFTSPLKLFAYMASGKPIVASRLPSLKEVLDDDGAYFVPPDDPSALRASILKVLSNPNEAEQKALHAKELVKKYNWANRASYILSCIKK